MDDSLSSLSHKRAFQQPEAKQDLFQRTDTSSGQCQALQCNPGTFEEYGREDEVPKS